MNPELKILLEEAGTFHSHLGPFLVLGLKAGLLALRKLGAERGDAQLHAQVQLPYRVPISCLLDGIQFSTGCTVGNKRLSFKDSINIRLTFTKNGKNLELTLKQTQLWFLSSLFHGEQLSQRELSDLVHQTAIMNENELFLLREAGQSTQPTF
jgi:formylmethanofuran dehydrogenase subunit E